MDAFKFEQSMELCPNSGVCCQIQRSQKTHVNVEVYGKQQYCLPKNKYKQIATLERSLTCSETSYSVPKLIPDFLKSI